MAPIAEAAAIVLAVVFTWAAVAKLVNRADTVASWHAMGLPVPAALAFVVPVVELGCAVALIAIPAAGGIAALALLGLFTGVLLANRHKDLGCACFGRLTTRPVTGADVVRNGVLAALAVVSTFGGR